jgi:hypothetical protein
MYYVNGNLSLPFVFGVKAESQEAAISYAMSLFNEKEIVKIEADLHSKNGKCHLLICDEFILKIAE